MFEPYEGLFEWFESLEFLLMWLQPLMCWLSILDLFESLFEGFRLVIKGLADQLVYLEMLVTNGEVNMILLKNLAPSYKYLITVLDTKPMLRLMHEL